MRKQILLLLTGIALIEMLQAQLPATPDKLYGRFFHDVQMARVFADSKTFVDCTPKKSPAEIVAAYQKITSNPAIRFSIKLFTEENFEQPATPQLNYITKEKDIQQHIKNLWSVLKRKADTVANIPGNSLLPLPFPYIVPGGRFREIYYWDSYFTMLGLKESGESDMIESMVRNFAYLIDSFGHVPNGNRTYYLSRSQPPFFSLMVELLASIKGDQVYATYLPQLEKEYKYWMEGSDKLKPMQVERSVVKLKDGSVLNRYWDELDIPRQEAYYEDQTLAEKYPAKAKKLNRDIRAAAASGWDFSSRWFADSKNISTIQTTNIIPVDLNCLLYKLELTIAKAKLVTSNDSTVALYRKKASARLAAIDKYCWNKSVTFYTDYNFTTQKQSPVVTPAGMYPFCFFTEKTDYMSLLARNVGEVIKVKLLKPGGIVTTENNTGQQWDAPNGWAPLQWMTIWGLDKCGQKELARDIAERWLKLNLDVFNRTGKLMEKYNVVDNKLDAGGGEYPSQDGFGWTNGVFLKLISMYGMPQ